jgi:hypothetical protein
MTATSTARLGHVDDRTRLVGRGHRDTGNAPDDLRLYAHRHRRQRDEQQAAGTGDHPATMNGTRHERRDREQRELEREQRGRAAFGAAPARRRSRRRTRSRRWPAPNARPARARPPERHAEEHDVAALVGGEHAEEAPEADRVDEAGDPGQHCRTDERPDHAAIDRGRLVGRAARTVDTGTGLRPGTSHDDTAVRRGCRTAVRCACATDPSGGET